MPIVIYFAVSSSLYRWWCRIYTNKVCIFLAFFSLHSNSSRKKYHTHIEFARNKSLHQISQKLYVCYVNMCDVFAWLAMARSIVLACSIHARREWRSVRIAMCEIVGSSMISLHWRGENTHVLCDMMQKTQSSTEEETI